MLAVGEGWGVSAVATLVAGRVMAALLLPLMAPAAVASEASVTVTGASPVLVGNRTGQRLFFPLLQFPLGGDASRGIMLRAQTSPDAEGSPTSPNTDAVFLSKDLGKSWSLLEENDPVQKRQCITVKAADYGIRRADVVTATLCLPYAYHPPPTPIAPACQAALDAYCNNETLDGATCIDPQRKQWGRSMAPYTALHAAVPQRSPAAQWRCFSHEALVDGKWSAKAKTPN
eukprot:COSAG04_NODE_7303_length_1150_cov_40.054234_2_plen_229_part_01